MSVKLSKNAQKGVADVFHCRCGGQVTMVDVFRHGKIRHEARCKACGKVARFPRELV